MKKAIVSILAFLYLSVSSGIAMEIHYCMGEKAGIDLYGSGSNKCHKCGMQEKKGCCNDEHKFYKLNDSHKNVSNDISFEHFSTVTIVPYLGYNWHITTDTFTNNFHNNSPPDDTSPSACILNCVFRI